MVLTKVNGPLPGPKSRELLERWHQYEADVVGYQAPVVWDTAEGCRVTDVDGNTFIDWTSGVLVANVGHCHPHLVKAVQNSAARLLNNYECANVERIQAAERLVKALPDHLDKCFFLSTGSEAIEGALRLMKRRTGHYEVLCFQCGFHGRTAHAASAGGMAGPKRSYGPAVPGFIRLPFPHPYRDPLGLCDDSDGFKRYFDFADEIVRANSTGSLAGALIEPYQGAAGFIFPPKGWLKRLEEWVHGWGGLFVLDEVQSSYGRTGKMWAMEHEDLRPDIVTLGKGIGSGISVSAVCATLDVFSCLKKGEMSSTLGGNPVSSAAVTAVLEIMEKEKLADNSARMGEKLKEGLKAIARKSRHLGDVRGMGMVMGLEIVQDKESRRPAPELIRPIIDGCANKGLLVGSVGVHGNVIRVAPPLVISEEEVAVSLPIMESVLMDLESE